MRVQQRRKNPLPMVRAAQGNGICLLEHGEPRYPGRRRTRLLGVYGSEQCQGWRVTR